MKVEETVRTLQLGTLEGSAMIPCLSSSSHFACIKSLHWRLNCGAQSFVGGVLFSSRKPKVA